MRWITAILLASMLTISACNGDSDPDRVTDGSLADDDNGGQWQPGISDTWHWQLTGSVNTTYDVDVYDIDLVDNSADLIRQLQDNGHRVICYFSAGSYENWRPDAGNFDQTDLGGTLDGWPDERWLDIRSAKVRSIMMSRLDLAVQKGCDGVEPDNIDGYSNQTGFPLTAGDQLDYNRFLAQAAHDRYLAIGLKNDIDQVAVLVDDFDFAINEQCHEYEECGILTFFTQAGKPVFNAEYADDYIEDAALRQVLCTDAWNHDLRTLVLPLDLDDSFRYSSD